MVIERLARAHKAGYFWSRYSGKAAKIKFGPEEVLLLKPQTYMNRSGRSVAAGLKKMNIYPDQLIVIHDDLDLALGQIKVGFGMKSAGHKGLESIIQETGTKDFFRVRLGIGKPAGEQDAVEYVLAPFAGEEWKEADRMIDQACEAVEMLVTEGLEKTQNVFNKRK